MKKQFDYERIMRKVINKYPIMGSILDNIKYHMVENNEIPTACTDGQDLFFNKDFMDSLDEKEQIFVFAHEMAHIALDHIMRSEGKDKNLWNIATDAVINQELLKDRLKMPEGCINIKEALTHSAEWVYNKLLEKRKKLQISANQQGQKQDGNQSGQNGQSTSSVQEQSNQEHTSQDSQNQNQKDNQGKKNKDHKGIKDHNPTSIEDMDLSDFNENVNNHGMWADAVKKAREAQQNKQFGNSRQTDKRNQDDKNPRNADGEEKDIKTDAQNHSNEKYKSPKGEMRKGEKERQEENSNRPDKEQRIKDRKLNKRKLKKTKFVQEEREDDSDQQNGINQDQNGANKQSSKDDQTSDSQNEEQMQDQNNTNQDHPNSKDTNQDSNMIKPISHDETDFFSKNRDNVFEQASKVISKRGSNGYGLGNANALPTSVVFGDVGQAQQGVAQWRKVLKSSLEKSDDKWDYDDYQDPGDPYDRRKIYEVDKDERASTEVICDVSGSVSHELIKCFLRQIKSMIKETEMKVGFFADYFYGFTIIKKKSDIDNLRVPTGGGTNFDAASRAFTTDKEINKICFTDGCDGGDAGIVNKRNDIIWISFVNENFKPDYGKVIYVPEEKIYESEMRLLGDNNSFNDNDRNI